jgi:Carboxypeptidase regulatory-like domain
MPQARLFSLLAPLALLALTTPIAAQGTTACLQGRVFGGPGRPIAGARVTLMSTGFSTSTDDSGRYTIRAMPADTISVRVTYVGHRSSQVDRLPLPAGGILRQDFVLEPSTQAGEAGAGEVGRTDSVRAAPPRTPAVPCPRAVPEYGAGSFVDKLPVDQVSRVLTIAPGTRTVGPPGETNTYVDGVPVQSRVKITDSTTGRIEGVIRSEAGTRLAGVRVAIIGTTLSSVTDSLGRFTLPSVPPGMIAIRVTRPEYRDALIEGLRIRGGQLILQDVVLARAP